MNTDIVTGRRNPRIMQLPDRFDSPDYNVLLAADKYQTGYRPAQASGYVRRQATGWSTGGPDSVPAQPHGTRETGPVRP